MTPAPTATPGTTIVPFGSLTERATPTPGDGPIVRPFGESERNATATAVADRRYRLLREERLLEEYGAAAYATLNAMPDDLRGYFTTTISDIASFFGVREEDLITVIRVQNEGALRLFVEEQGGGTAGIARLSARQWNGWASPEHERYLRDLRAIEQNGGLGFDWSRRFQWQAWTEGNVTAGSSFGTTTDPARFDNNVAALARYLVRHGATREAVAASPVSFGREFERAISELRGATAEADAGAGGGQHASLAAAPEATVALREAYSALMDESFALALSESDLLDLVDGSAVAAEVIEGQSGVQEGAMRLLEETRERFLQEARDARARGRPLPWPFADTEERLRAQELAAHHLGHTFTAWELDALLDDAGGDLALYEASLLERADAELFAEVKARLDQALQRSVRGLPLRQSEAARLAQAILGPYNQRLLGSWNLNNVVSELEQRMRRLPEFRALHGDLFFEAAPFSPMPERIIQRFGVPVSYDASGYHTGLDIRGERQGSGEAPIYAVHGGTVVHVGPIYCNEPRLCRGPHAIIIDHGNNIYTTYSHNSAALVTVGDVVTAGQMIARQGNLGYSRGPHLHLEVHVGAPYSGDWTEPWYGGRFVDPWPWLPREEDLARGP